MEVPQLKSSPVETAVQHDCKELSANNESLITHLLTLKGELSSKQYNKTTVVSPQGIALESIRILGR